MEGDEDYGNGDYGDVMICSLGECRRPIIGTGVLLKDDADGIDWRAGGFWTYKALLDERIIEWIILHPTCFVDLFHELMRQGQQAMFWVGVGHTANIQEALKV